MNNVLLGVDRYVLLQYFSWGFLTFNSATAIYRSLDEPWAVAFVLVAYANLILLFVSLRLFDKAPEGSDKRNKLKYLVWLLASSLTVIFSYKVATVMPLVLKVIVWAMAALTTAGGFYGLVLYEDKNAQKI